MATTIYNTIANVGDIVQDDIKATIQLSWNKASSPLPRVNDASPTSYEGDLVVRTDQNGRWEATVENNLAILPANSVYKITETEGTKERAVYYVSVAASVTPVWVGSILAATPAWEE